MHCEIQSWIGLGVVYFTGIYLPIQYLGLDRRIDLETRELIGLRKLEYISTKTDVETNLRSNH